MLLIIIIIVSFICAIVVGTYIFISKNITKEKLSKLEEYDFVEYEKQIKSFEYKGKKYLISRYYDDTSSWSHLNILLKYKDKYYRLENITKCDSTEDGENIFVDENNIYIHCIGKAGNILKYSINNTTVDKDTLTFNYDNASNISQIHITIDKVDKDYIYLVSLVKNDPSEAKGLRVKCSLSNYVCSYD